MFTFKHTMLNKIRLRIEKKMMNCHSFCFQWKRTINFFQSQKQRTKWTSKTILFATKTLKTLFHMRTLILSSEQESCRQKNLCLRYKEKLLTCDSNSNHSRSKNSTKNSKKRFVSLSTKQRMLFQKNDWKNRFEKYQFHEIIDWISHCSKNSAKV